MQYHLYLWCLCVIISNLLNWGMRQTRKSECWTVVGLVLITGGNLQNQIAKKMNVPGPTNCCFRSRLAVFPPIFDIIRLQYRGGQVLFESTKCCKVAYWHFILFYCFANVNHSVIAECLSTRALQPWHLTLEPYWNNTKQSFMTCQMKKNRKPFHHWLLKEECYWKLEILVLFVNGLHSIVANNTCALVLHNILGPGHNILYLYYYCKVRQHS